MVGADGAEHKCAGGSAMPLRESPYSTRPICGGEKLVINHWRYGIDLVHALATTCNVRKARKPLWTSRAGGLRWINRAHAVLEAKIQIWKVFALLMAYAASAIRLQITLHGCTIIGGA